MIAAGVAGGMVAATRAAVGGASALAQRAAYGAGVLFGGATRGAEQTERHRPPLGASKGAAGAAGRSAVEGFKARLSRATAPFRDSFRAGAERSANVDRASRPRRDQEQRPAHTRLVETSARLEFPDRPVFPAGRQRK